MKEIIGLIVVFIMVLASVCYGYDTHQYAMNVVESAHETLERIETEEILMENLFVERTGSGR